MPEPIRYVVIYVPEAGTDYPPMDRYAKVNVGAIREIAQADVVIAVDPMLQAKVVTSRLHEEPAVVTIIQAIDGQRVTRLQV